MLNPTSKFKYKKPTFGVINPANQSNLDGFFKKANNSGLPSSSNEQERSKFSYASRSDSQFKPKNVSAVEKTVPSQFKPKNVSAVEKTLPKSPEKPAICLPSVKNNHISSTSVDCPKENSNNVDEAEFDDFLDDVEIKSYSDKVDRTNDSQNMDDSLVCTLDYTNTYGMEKSSRPKDMEFDIQFDYGDWSRPRSKKKSSSKSTTENMKNGYVNEGVVDNFADFEFDTSLNLKDDDQIENIMNLNEKTPEKSPHSPPLFDLSPVIDSDKLFPKKFKLKTPVAAKLYANPPLPTVLPSSDRVLPSEIDSISTYCDVELTKSDTKTNDSSNILDSDSFSSNCNTKTDFSVVSDSGTGNKHFPTVSNWLKDAQTKCFGNVARNNSILNLEANLTLLRSYEKELNDLAFEWFISMPEFVAEQLTYVGEATELIRLRAFRDRLREKLIEFEKRSMEAFATSETVESEEFSRVNRQMKTLSSIVRSVKKRMSPDKRAAGRSAVRDERSPTPSSLATSSSRFADNENDDDDDKALLQSDSDEDLMAASWDRGLSKVVASTVRPLQRYDDADSLPSTQEVDRVYDDWNPRTEKRKRSPSVDRERRAVKSCAGEANSCATSRAASSSSSSVAAGGSKFKFKTSIVGRGNDDASPQPASTHSKEPFSKLDESLIADFIDSEVIREFESDDSVLLEAAAIATTSTAASCNVSSTVANNWKDTLPARKSKFMYSSDSEDELPCKQQNVLSGPSTSKGATETSEQNVVGSVYGKFSGDFPNDGLSGEFSRSDYRHSNELNRVFKSRFGLHKFRPNQLEAINAAMLGHDCFILMPTGGGKSLCYQLPAILTRGVTIVISPLISLIVDQTEKLKALDIPAAHLLGETTVSDMNAIYMDLSKKDPPLKLLYVTPEKIASSCQLKSAFTNLYQRQLLGRFVIDEAHCVSQWGHDFRPDYKRLNSLRENYPSVPIMALTATATPRVRNDILHQLHIRSPKWFISSFNRPNLKYEVVPKKTPKTALEEVMDLIKHKFNRMAGIVYCLSRKECDSCAAEFNSNSIKASSYHAGLADKKRNMVQSQWISNKIHVVCATIAFGMGIDKPDVRFVIHYCLPKSIEGYYQESGRAGRDGKLSWCILYYSFQDSTRIRKLIEFGDGSAESKEVHFCNLWRMVRFCENKMECRRSLQLNYFGEYFKREICIAGRSATCDNCSQLGTYKNHDLTEDCKAILSFVAENCGNASTVSWGKNFTSNYIADILAGSKAKKIQEAHMRHPVYGRGKDFSRVDIDRLLHQLILQGYLVEKMTATRADIVNAYVKLGPRANELLTGSVKIMFPMTECLAVKAKVGGSRGNALDIKTKRVQTDELEKLQEDCYQELVVVRDSLAEEFSIQPNSIVSLGALKAMSEMLPDSAEQMLTIDGISEVIFRKFGKFMLDVTTRFALEKKNLPCEKTNEQLQGGECDPLLWQGEDDTPSPYFRNSRSSSGGGSQPRCAKKTTKRKFRRKKKTSPTKKRAAGTRAKKKSPKKTIAPNRALGGKKLGFMLPKQYAHMNAKSS